MSPNKTKLLGIPVEDVAPPPDDDGPATVDSPRAGDERDTRDWTIEGPRRSASLVGTTVGSYNVTRLLGEGGIGAVYLGEHPLVGARVAIKVLHDNFTRSPVMLTRFTQEAQAANAIASPHIVRVSDFGNLEDGRPYAVMEFLEGQTVDALLTELGTIPWPRAVEIARQVAEGMAAAHEAGILHRDLKPENLFVQSRGEGRLMIRILDFGIAKLLESRKLANDAATAKSTAAGEVLGTPLYCSPEQALGKSVTPATDVYALGAVLYELLSGCPTFEGSAVELLIAKSTRDVPPIQSLCPDIPQALAALVMQMLARDPAARLSSMVEIMERLAALAGASSVASPALTLVSGPMSPSSVIVARGTTPTPGTPVAMSTQATASESIVPPVRRSRSWVTALAVAPILAIAAFALLRTGHDEAAPPPASGSGAPAETAIAEQRALPLPPKAAESPAPSASASASAPASATVLDPNSLPDTEAAPKKASPAPRSARPAPPSTPKRSPSETKAKIVNPFD